MDLMGLLRRAAPVKAPTTIRALFSLPGFVASAQRPGGFDDRCARALRLRRRNEARVAGSVACGAASGVGAIDLAILCQKLTNSRT